MNIANSIKKLTKIAQNSLCVGLLAVLSCTDEQVYMNATEGKWEKNKVQRFSFPINDHQIPKNIIFVVRNNNEYPYSNIRFFSVLKEDKMKSSKVDTLNYIMAKPNGEWLGTGFGGTKEIRFLYKENYLFPKNGTYTIEVKQAMRKDILLGIEDIGIQIVPVK